jgi:hypothetical protein
MHVVYKYPLMLGGATQIPAGPVVLLAEQYGTPMAWVQREEYELMPGHKMQVLHVFATGQAFPPEGLEHVGSMLGQSGFVWHVYRRYKDGTV